MKITIQTYFYTYLLSNILFLSATLLGGEDKIAFVQTQLCFNGIAWAAYSLIKMLKKWGV